MIINKLAEAMLKKGVRIDVQTQEDKQEPRKESFSDFGVYPDAPVLPAYLSELEIDRYKTPFYFAVGALVGLAIGLRVKRVTVIR